MKKNVALILDLDGTVRKTKSGKPCPNKPDDQELLPGVKQKILDAKKQGYKIVAVTNQGGIGLGYMTEKDCLDCLEELNKQLDGAFDLMLFAKAPPQHNDPWTKPNPGMIHHAAEKLGLDLEGSLMVGDRDTDEQAAKRAGVRFKYAKEFFDNGSKDARQREHRAG